MTAELPLRAPAPPPQPAAVGAPWLWSARSDLLFGAGLVFAPVLALLAVAGDAVQRALPFGLMPLLMLAINAPHLGAALLRVYERAADRRRYRFFALHATLAIAALFLLGLEIPRLGSWLITLYLTLVPWHFSAQNYGIALVFLRRRGIEPDPREKRSLQLAFAIPYAMTFLGLHGGGVGTVAPVDPSGTAYRFVSLPLPEPFVEVALLGCGIAWAGALFDVAARLSARAPARALGPAAAVLASQGLWFALPLLLEFAPGGRSSFAPYSAERHGYTTLWISLTHSAQYLWITSYFAARVSPPEGPARFLAKAWLAGSALYGVPLVLLSPAGLGHTPYDSGLLVMLAGALNLHHVVIDGAIWKLRSGAIARILIRGDADPIAAPGRRRRWIGALIYASGALGALLVALGSLEREIGFGRASLRGDLPRLELAARRLAWLAREDPALWARIGTLRAERGNLAGALEALERSTSLFPTATAWIDTGVVYERSGDPRSALAAFERAVELEPELPIALRYAGRAWSRAGDRARAAALLERAEALDPGGAAEPRS